MDEKVIAILTRDETIPLVLIKPLYFTFSHFLPFFLPCEAHTHDAECNQAIYATNQMDPFRPNRRFYHTVTKQFGKFE
jgi:hypothetical protein